MIAGKLYIEMAALTRPAELVVSTLQLSYQTDAKGSVVYANEPWTIQQINGTEATISNSVVVVTFTEKTQIWQHDGLQEIRTMTMASVVARDRAVV